MVLGRLEKVELRSIWNREDSDFTPWMAQEENITLLADTIGMELEVEAQEKEVGPFRADILCKDTANDRWVLIENQLEKTDHIHLGQLLTYAAGLQAATIVWIAGQFTDEHRAALDWLNEITDESFQFFGLEIELWRIGDSQVAPKFNIISKPNNWSRNISRAAISIQKESLTGTRLLYIDFWTHFREFILESNVNFKPTKPLPQNWMNISIGRSGFKLCAVASTQGIGSIRAELVLEDEDAKRHFAFFEAQKSEIEAELGELIWYSNPNVTSCRIYFELKSNLDNRDEWGEKFLWLKDHIQKLYDYFKPRVKNLI